MIDVRFKPLSTWPGTATPAHRRKKGGFSLGWNKILDSLERELTHLAASSTVIEGYFRDDHLRLDGWPKAGVSPSQPGVVLSFTSKHGALRIPCDYFIRYEDNLRAIALHLERLRLAAQFGIAQHGEQYKGWKALPPAGESIVDATIYAAARVVTELAGWPPDKHVGVKLDADLYREAYKVAARNAHPDTGAPRAKWDLLVGAKLILDEHHRIGKAATA